MDVQGLQQAVNIAGVGGEHVVARSVLGDERHQRVEDVGRSRCAEQLAGAPGQRPSATPPGLSHDQRGHDGSLTVPVKGGKQRSSA